MEEISSKVVFKHPRITLIEDIVQLPSGNMTDYLRIRDGKGAATIIAKRDNRILFQKEYSYPTNQILTQLPGGGIDTDKNLKDEANRELSEESGFKADSIETIGRYLMNNRRKDTYMYVFVASQLNKRQLEGDLEEDIENTWLTEDKVDRLISKSKIVNQATLAAWSIYKAQHSSS